MNKGFQPVRCLAPERYDHRIEKVRIRHARHDDAERIGQLVADGLAQKVRPAFGARGAQAVAALVRRDIDRPTVRYFVAEHEGTVVASTRLAIGQDLPAEGIAPLAKAIGWPAALRGALVLGLLAQRRLAPHEVYLEELVVAPESRRRGIGRTLLNRCDDEARQHGKRYVTLWVAATNTDAIRLYEAVGYDVVRTRLSIVGRLVFRTPAVVTMRRDLADNDEPLH